MKNFINRALVAKKHLKLFFALFAMLALGVGNAWAEEVTISYKDIPDGYTATTGTSGSFTKTVSATNDLTISYAGINTKSKATAAAHAYGYAMFLKNYGYIYSSSAPSGFYPSKVVVKFGSQTGTTGKAGISFGTNVLSTRNSNVTGAVSKSGTCSLENSDKTKLHWNFSTTSANVQVASVTVTYTSIGADETTYSVTLNQPAEGGTIEADKDEAAKGATVTLTATPDAGYKWESWTVTGASGNVTVSNNQFTMPAEDVTVTASFIAKTQYTIKWNVAEGSVEDSKVYEGDALGTLPDAPNCSEGKVFVGWTEATSVNPDGSGITYAKATDIPTGNKEYNAVYAVSGGTEDKVDELTQSWTGITGTTYTAWSDKKSNTSAIYSGQSAAGNAAIQLRATSPSGIITTTSGGKIKKIVVTWNSNTSNGRTLDVYGNNSAYSATTDLYSASTDGDILGSIVKGTSTELEVTGDYAYIGLRSASGAMYLDEVEITWEATSYSDYSLNCDINEEPALIPSIEELDFGAKYVGFEYTETFTINASNLAEDIALAIDGSTFTVSPTSIAKDATFPQTVTVNYAPTAVGTHNATLNITSGSTLSKTIALTGSATEATIYTLTALADINPTDKVIIVGTSSGNTYAMSNDKGTSDAPDAIAVTVIDNKIATDKTNILWNIAKDGDNLTIYPADQTAKWLYCLADNNDGVRVGTGEAKLFTIDKGYLYTTQTTAARHIGIYNNSDWRCYKPSADAIHTNIKDQSFAFYVLPNTDPFISATPTSYDFGAVLKGKQTTKEIAYTTTNISSSISVTISNPECFTVVHNSTTKICTVTYTPNAVGTHSATLTIKAEDEASTTVELTGECVEAVDVATAMAAAKDEIVYLKPFDVVYAVTGKEYVYIKDESGFGLIYDTDLANQLLNGDRVEGFVGKSSPYRSLPELKAHNTENMTITHGTAVEPTEFTTVPATSHVNQYVVFKNVTFDEDVVFNSSTATNATFKLNTNDVTLRNSFKFDVDFEADKAYDIYGAIATYQATESDPIEVQVYYLNSAEAGQEVVTYTVTYDANGASGNVPTDLANYAAGQQATVAGQGEMTYENHMFTGWKYNGTIYQAGDKFNMPADDVTLVAQWEERQTFSSGLWVLVTDASELAANDYIIVAAAAENFAMKSYESGNNCKQVAITKFGNNNCFLKWTEEIGVFQLLANGSNYTFQDVNTKQYLYAAGTGTSNQLKANSNIATDENASKYVWTIAVDENGIATVKATSENRNWLRYNTNSGSDLFSCYGSGQQDIVLYKYVTDFYTRDVVTGNLGTICLPYASSKHAGATFYEIAYLEMNGTDPNRIYLDEVEGGVLEAGKPYIFQATSNKVTVAYEGEASSLKEGVKGLVGILEDSKVVNGQEGVSNILTGNYVISGTKFYTCGTGCSIYKNRAYIDASIIANHTTPVAEMPGRRRIAMGAAGENQVTGVDNTLAPKDNVVKVIENGQLIIIRDGVKYNVQGQKL